LGRTCSIHLQQPRCAADQRNVLAKLCGILHLLHRISDVLNHYIPVCTAGLARSLLRRREERSCQPLRHSTPAAQNFRCVESLHSRLHRRTRAQFAAQVPGFTFKQQADDMEYKTIIVPPLGEKEPAPYFTLFDEERNAFFVCARDVVAGGRTRGVYVLNKGGFANLKTQKDYYKALQKSFPAPFSDVSELKCIATSQPPIRKGAGGNTEAAGSDRSGRTVSVLGPQDSGRIVA
jgi:hypothetical protein